MGKLLQQYNKILGYPQNQPKAKIQVANIPGHWQLLLKSLLSARVLGLEIEVSSKILALFRFSLLTTYCQCGDLHTRSRRYKKLPPYVHSIWQRSFFQMDFIFFFKLCNCVYICLLLLIFFCQILLLTVHVHMNTSLLIHRGGGPLVYLSMGWNDRAKLLERAQL